MATMYEILHPDEKWVQDIYFSRPWIIKAIKQSGVPCKISGTMVSMPEWVNQLIDFYLNNKDSLKGVRLEAFLEKSRLELKL